MKTLHFVLVATVLAVIGVTSGQDDAYASTPSNDLGDGNVFSMTTNGAFFPGNYIEIDGNLVTVNPIKITLDDPHGIVIASKTTFSDRTGNFISELKIPENATAGTWNIMGTSGIYQKQLNFTIADSSAIATCYAGDLCSSVLHMTSNDTSGYIPGVNATTVSSPLEQFRANIAAHDVKCRIDLQLVLKAEDGSPACVKPDTASILSIRGWTESVTGSIMQTMDMQNTKNYNPFGITALVIYEPTFGCPIANDTVTVNCPENDFYLKINSASTAYLLSYNICDGNSCTKSDDLSVLLPINSLKPNYQIIALPANLQWKDGDVTNIQLEISSTLDNKTGLQINYENSTIVPE